MRPFPLSSDSAAKPAGTGSAGAGISIADTAATAGSIAGATASSGTASSADTAGLV
ncbi:MAG: hypothetical protein MSC45_00695 [Mobiluncus sp.]|uniref:hypothetical protein n=1 Tax=Mobiluncus sp. TaxID=47293 RepID=UPI002589B370|nr:hypothetical protein [Mobiluncus sp.]MCI6583574.1 hypothetical protein [Mobiluncus sp.]